MFLINQPYFIVLQLLLFIAFWLLRNKNTTNNFLIPLTPLHFSLLVFAALMNGIFFNKTYQIYCIPVTWASTTLGIYFSYLVLHPFFSKFQQSIFHPIILGMGLLIATYLIAFGHIPYLIYLAGNALIILPLSYFIRFLNKRFQSNAFNAFHLLFLSIALPYFIIYWTIRQVLGKSRKHQLALLVMPILFCCSGLFLSYNINQVITKIEQSENKIVSLQTHLTNPIHQYATELTLGAHWKYHTRICIYDGWRPPFHDPVLGFAKIVLYQQHDFHTQMKLAERKQLYQVIFPNNPINFHCQCAIKERIGN